MTERRLGTWPIFVIAVSAMTPLTVVAGALPLGYGQVEEKGIPVAYMLVAAVLGVFAVGLAAMARHVPNRGAFYAYAAAGLSRPAGVGTAFVALLAYNAMQIGLYGAFGVAAHNAMAIFGVEISWIVWALLGWALIAVLGRLNIDLNARILTVLVCAEVLIVLVLDAAMLGNPAGGTVTFDTLNPALIASAGGVALLVAAVAGMVGFEAPLVYAAEARDPRRTVARAIGLTLLVAAVLYGGTAWVMSVAAGPDQIIVVAADHLDDLFFFLPEPYLPAVVIDLARVFFATSLFAAMLAFHHTVARYALTVAREGVLPGPLARTRKDVPVAASLAQSGLALGVLLIFALAGWNPTTDLFFFGTVSGGLGVLVLMVIAAIAVVRYFRADGHGETRWRRSIAPWTALVFLVLILLLTVASFGILLDSDNLLKVWSPPLAFLLLFLVGVRWGRQLRRERPEVYAVIGSGLPPSAPESASSSGAGGEGSGESPSQRGAAEASAEAAEAGPGEGVGESKAVMGAAPAAAGPAREEEGGASKVAAQPAGSERVGVSRADAGDDPGVQPAGGGETGASEAARSADSAEEGEGGSGGLKSGKTASTSASPPQVTSPRKRAAASRRAAKPADGTPATAVPGEAVESAPTNGASGAPAPVRRPRTPRARRSPGSGSSAQAPRTGAGGSATGAGTGASAAGAGTGGSATGAGMGEAATGADVGDEAGAGGPVSRTGAGNSATGAGASALEPKTGFGGSPGDTASASSGRPTTAGESASSAGSAAGSQPSVPEDTSPSVQISGTAPIAAASGPVQRDQSAEPSSVAELPEDAQATPAQGQDPAKLPRRRAPRARKPDPGGTEGLS
ncbi:APC family permease [Actinoplanes sp. NBC_00393]|uniref:APC family permease n=1 Tax=Actinoplanes sp. NBC_00393 TaxID=2975953 RepID=UPI002E22F047